MSDAVFFIIAFGLMMTAGLAAYAWRKRTTTRWRMGGGIMLILAPICLQIAFVLVAMTNIAHLLNSLSPVSEVTPFEAAWFLTLFWSPFWSIGALCGYMLRASIDRPLRF